MSDLVLYNGQASETTFLPITLVIIDDEEQIREGLRILLQNSGEIEVLAVGCSGEDAVMLTSKHQPQVLLLDLHFPTGIDGIEAIEQISARQELQTKILVYTIDAEESTIFKAIKAGANSYVWKDEAYTDLKEAVLATARGEAYVSPALAQIVLEFFEMVERRNSIGI